MHLKTQVRNSQLCIQSQRAQASRAWVTRAIRPKHHHFCFLLIKDLDHPDFNVIKTN